MQHQPPIIHPAPVEPADFAAPAPTPAQSPVTPPAPVTEPEVPEALYQSGPPLEPPAPSALTPLPHDNPATAPPHMPADFGRAPQLHDGASGTDPNTPPAGYKPPKRKKTSLIVGLLLFLLIAGGAAAFYFFWYVPNLPNNVWATGFKQTGQLVDKLTADKGTAEALKSVDLSSDIQVAVDDDSFRGNLAMQYEDQKATGEIKVGTTLKGKDSNVAVKFLSSVADKAQYPDIYFMLTGLKDLGLDASFPQAMPYEGKWISLDAAYLEKLAGSTQKKPDATPTFNSNDAAALTKIVVTTTNEYVLTDDQDKVIIVQKEFVGEEKSDGITANHYTAGLDKDKTKKFCRVLVERLMNSDAYTHLPESFRATSKEDALKECDKEENTNFSEDDNFDIWIDKKTKILQRIRFTDKEDKKSYVEFGQRFTSGDDIPVYVKFHAEKNKFDGEVTFTANVKARTTKGSAKFTVTEEQKVEVSGSFTLKPYDGEIKVDKPAAVITFEQVMNDLGVKP